MKNKNIKNRVGPCTIVSNAFVVDVTFLVADVTRLNQMFAYPTV